MRINCHFRMFWNKKEGVSLKLVYLINFQLIDLCTDIFSPRGHLVWKSAKSCLSQVWSFFPLDFASPSIRILLPTPIYVGWGSFRVWKQINCRSSTILQKLNQFFLQRPRKLFFITFNFTILLLFLHPSKYFSQF